jgi:hypothetical protein
MEPVTCINAKPPVPRQPAEQSQRAMCGERARRARAAEEERGGGARRRSEAGAQAFDRRLLDLTLEQVHLRRDPLLGHRPAALLPRGLHCTRSGSCQQPTPAPATSPDLVGRRPPLGSGPLTKHCGSDRGASTMRARPRSSTIGGMERTGDLDCARVDGGPCGAVCPAGGCWRTTVGARRVPGRVPAVGVP